MEETSSKAPLYSVLPVVVIALMGVGVFLLFRKPAPIPAPASLVTVPAPDGSSVCQGSAGWTVKTGAANSVAARVSFRTGSAQIKFVSDLTGGLLADIPRIPTALNPNPRPPIESVHDLGQRQMKDELKEYVEGPAQPFRSSLGDSRYSEFTADGGFGVGKLHGYRASMLTNERRVSIVCQCAGDDWNTLRPVFTAAINSVGPGKG